MKLTYLLVAALLIVLTWSNCKKERSIIPEKNQKNSEQLPLPGSILSACDDTTAFKSNVDLQPLEFLWDCYVCTAVKQVPGLGEIPWVGNCQAFSPSGTTMEIRFTTYEQYFEELLLREEIAISSIPVDTGTFILVDYFQWQQNQSLSYGSYSRSLDDGDVADGFWDIDTTCTNYIEITRLDQADREIEGRFEIHLKMKTQGTHGILYSERINFLSGKFKAQLLY